MKKSTDSSAQIINWLTKLFSLNVQVGVLVIDITFNKFYKKFR